jgi:hypothetical protein
MRFGVFQEYCSKVPAFQKDSANIGDWPDHDARLALWADICHLDISHHSHDPRMVDCAKGHGVWAHFRFLGGNGCCHAIYNRDPVGKVWISDHASGLYCHYDDLVKATVGLLSLSGAILLAIMSIAQVFGQSVLEYLSDNKLPFNVLAGGCCVISATGAFTLLGSGPLHGAPRYFQLGSWLLYLWVWYFASGHERIC